VRTTVSSYESRSSRYQPTLWLGGCIALGAVTATCVLLDLELGTAGLSLLVVIVLLSLLDSSISSVIFSVVGVALLSYFSPLLSFSSRQSQSRPLSGGLAALRKRSALRLSYWN
jgi:membrane protein implicated in regulation of membrane protease activity